MSGGGAHFRQSGWGRPGRRMDKDVGPLRMTGDRRPWLAPVLTSPLMRMEYPVKVLLAWGEAISGNAGIRDWLIRNGYRELGLFVFALHLKDDARNWLMKNGFPHLMAVIRGIEGDQKALEWLETHNMLVLRKVAESGGDKEAFEWLLRNGHRELAMLGLKMWSVKMQIEERNRDPHKYSRD